MASRKRRNGQDELDEDALTTMWDSPVPHFADEGEDDSDLDSTQLEWVSPLDPEFAGGKAPETFPADEPLPPARRLASDFGAPIEDTDSYDEIPDEERTALEPAVPPAAEATAVNAAPDALESQDLALSDLVPVDEATVPPAGATVESPPPVPRNPPPGAEAPAPPMARSLPRGEPLAQRQLSARVPVLSDGNVRARKSRRDLPAVRRPPSGPLPERRRSSGLLRLVTVGLVVGVLLALLLVALAAVGWYATA